ncbi:MAG: hypothetical protein AAFR94_02560 [Pseudomonadota bacterium]
MHRSSLFFVSATLFALPVAAQTYPAALAAALDAPSDGPVYAYEMVYETADIQAEGVVDATRPEGERIIVTAPAKSDWPEGFADGLEDLDRDADGDIWCNSLGVHVPSTVSLVEETPDRAIYSFTPNPEADADDTDKKVFRNLEATIEVDKANPAILAFSMRAPKSFKPAMVARINTFDMTVSCARAPDGRTYVSDLRVDISGSALGQAFNESTRRTILRLLPAANPVRGE